MPTRQPSRCQIAWWMLTGNRFKQFGVGLGITLGLFGVVGLTAAMQQPVAQSGPWVMTGFKDSGGTDMTDTSLHALKVAIQNGSNTVTDAATQSAGASSVATTEAYMQGFDGTGYARVYVDPCQGGTKTYTPISLTASGQVLAGTSSKKTYVCHLEIVTATAQNIALVEGTGTVCATSIAGMAGGTTAATGWNFAANGGINLGNGASSVAAEATNADNICLLLSSTGQTSGVLVTAVR